MDFLHELHKRSKDVSTSHADKVYNDLVRGKPSLASKGMFGQKIAAEKGRADLYHLGGTRGSYDIYLDKNAH